MTRGDAAAVPTARIAVCFGARGDGAGDDNEKGSSRTRKRLSESPVVFLKNFFRYDH
jgi:hypothetical protein